MKNSINGIQQYYQTIWDLERHQRHAIQEMMEILKNVQNEMNLQKKKEQEDAWQVKIKSIALQGTQEDSSTGKVIMRRMMI